MTDTKKNFYYKWSYLDSPDKYFSDDKINRIREDQVIWKKVQIQSTSLHFYLSLCFYFAIIQNIKENLE